MHRVNAHKSSKWQFMSLTSIRSRLILFLLVLILPVLAVIYWFVEQENLRYTDRTINSYLNIGTQVFDYSVESHKNTLLTISNALTRDWGFRNAFGAADPMTIRDAATNLLARSQGAADLMLISDMQGRVIIDTHDQGFSSLPADWRAVVDNAVTHPEGQGDRILIVGEVPYQITVVPLMLPQPVAWIFAGFPLDESFVREIRRSTASEISILRHRPAQATAAALEVVASSLEGDNRRLLAERLDPSRMNETQRVSLATESYGAQVRQLASGDAETPAILAVVQRSYRENQENLQVLQQRLLDFSIAIVSISLLAVFVLARGFTRPVLRLATRVEQIERGQYQLADGDRVVTGKDEVGELERAVERMANGLAEKEKVRDLLGKVVSQGVADELLSRRIELGGEDREVSILFADIAGFTALGERVPPQQLISILNTCLEGLCRVVDQHGGIVDKFIGDAVMAVFGAPVSHADDHQRALECAMAMQAELPAINEMLRAYEFPVSISVRIGVHTGHVVAGNIGSSDRLNYTVIGDAVNLAARLEGLTRFYNLAALISEQTRVAADPDNRIVWRDIDLVTVSGREKPVKLFEPVAHRDTLSQGEIDQVEQFNKALDCYRQGQGEEAAGIIAMLVEKAHPASNIQLYELYLERIRTQADMADEHWDPVFRHTGK